ncbi:protein-disulfide reductase DsbD family protein [Sinimarinibacterium sp. CAU 1509]|uniref:protein-disulfide reductase DsbD family protein n=1 Tax=Sinimarinibacterium sp. CAU 1509 TaxID=2562283 RepID=UPI00200B6EE2|nr:protein-disulfide reductase DsbD domain-containing protein [Sinimarinibacterium sp. CAU 1509]
MKRLLLPWLSALLLGSLATSPLHAAPVSTPEVEAELIAENTALVPGENWVALRLRPTPEWHVYWRNPGDSGIPTKLQWTLPDGVTAGEIQWPYPHAESLGDLTNYGYSTETLHLVPLTVSPDLSAKTLTLKATASWLACRDVCVPGKVDLSLSLPFAAQTHANPDWTPNFAAARAQLPQPAHDWPAAFSVDGGSVSLRIEADQLLGAEHLAFFPYANDLVNHAAPARIAHDSDTAVRLSQSLSEYFVDPPETVDGVLVVERDGQSRAWEIQARPGTVAMVSEPELRAPPAAGISASTATPAVAPGFLLVLLFALLGGLVLNLMPCVFPVLSLKALSLVKGGNHDASERRRQVYAYTVGVVASCVLVAAAMIGLRSAGEAVGWGFQLQSPVFIGILAYVMFALGLSLSGAAQFGMGLMGLGSGLAARPGLSGSFFTGVLAVVVASPCTAPFMGTAMGYAMTQPTYVALTVFATLGLGLALPFLLIGWFPQLAALLPKPGAWMELFKQFMAFPLYLTVVWLLWVLVRQTDAQMMARVMMGLVLIAFAMWLWNRSGPLSASLKLGALAAAIGLLFVAPVASIGGPNHGDTAEAWSPQRVAELRADGRTIFVDFTADWCLTCKVNERVALKSSRVEQLFTDRDVAVLVGDWTRSDPAITAELARFGRNGVPLYLVYVRGGEPKMLPQLLTPEIVAKALE